MYNTIGTVGIVSVNEDGNAVVECVGDSITVTVPAPKEVAVYDITGRKVAETYVESSCMFRLLKGIYVVEGAKVFVK